MKISCKNICHAYLEGGGLVQYPASPPCPPLLKQTKNTENKTFSVRFETVINNKEKKNTLGGRSGHMDRDRLNPGGGRQRFFLE